MTRVGELCRVARVATEVKDPAVQHDSHVTTPRDTSRTTRDSPSGAPGQLALGEGCLGSRSSSPGGSAWHANFLRTTSRKGWSSVERRNAPARMQALEQRAPLFYPERPQSTTDSSSLPQEAIQAEVARQLAISDQRSQAQDFEIQSLSRVPRLRQLRAEFELMASLMK